MKNINRSEVHKVSEEKLKALRTELAEFKLLELSLGKRIENFVKDTNEHEAKIEELKAENEKLKRLLKHPYVTKKQREANLDYNLKALEDR